MCGDDLHMMKIWTACFWHASFQLPFLHSDFPMDYDPQDAAYILSKAANVLQKDEPAPLKLKRLWRTLMVFHANLLALSLKNTAGHHVLSGPFKDMQLTPGVMVKIFGPILTGCYEQELHPIFEQVIGKPYTRIVNIGCGFGYYSVGLALRMPQVIVHAFDIDPNEQKRCREMAVLNGVQDRVHVGGEFRGEDFATYVGDKTLLIVDIEGVEVILLDPARYPALRSMDMILELHDIYDASISLNIGQRFMSTHDVEIILNRQELFDFSPILGSVYMDALDQLLINWENRDGPTPWAVMRAR